MRENQIFMWPDDTEPSVYFLFKGALKKSRYSPAEFDKEEKD